MGASPLDATKVNRMTSYGYSENTTSSPAIVPLFETTGKCSFRLPRNTGARVHTRTRLETPPVAVTKGRA